VKLRHLVVILCRRMSQASICVLPNFACLSVCGYKIGAVHNEEPGNTVENPLVLSSDEDSSIEKPNPPPQATKTKPPNKKAKPRKGETDDTVENPLVPSSDKDSSSKKLVQNPPKAKQPKPPNKTATMRMSETVPYVWPFPSRKLQLKTQLELCEKCKASAAQLKREDGTLICPVCHSTKT